MIALNRQLIDFCGGLSCRGNICLFDNIRAEHCDDKHRREAQPAPHSQRERERETHTAALPSQAALQFPASFCWKTFLSHPIRHTTCQWCQELACCPPPFGEATCSPSAAGYHIPEGGNLPPAARRAAPINYFTLMKHQLFFLGPWPAFRSQKGWAAAAASSFTRPQPAHKPRATLPSLSLFPLKSAA